MNNVPDPKGAGETTVSRDADSPVTLATSWRPEDLALVFLTCPREPAYFPATLASALLGDPLTNRFPEIVVAVDAPDLACVSPLEKNRRIRWVPRTDEENQRVARFHVHRRACHNYWRALTLATPNVKGVMVCEDDVVFRDGWMEMLLDCLNEMRQNKMEAFLLAAYSAFDHEDRWLRRKRCYSSYVAHGFFGTQAMFYPVAELPALTQLLWEHGVAVSGAPYDLLIQRYAIARQHLYTTRHSLVQHVGARSTGLGDGKHRSPSFGRPWPKPETP